MRVYVVRKYHGRSSWSDPKHLAKYTEKEFLARSEALAYRESLGLNGIIEVYCREVGK
nr:MAG TPA: hypothetical protein [Caudoviricetes sp.]